MLNDPADKFEAAAEAEYKAFTQAQDDALAALEAEDEVYTEEQEAEDWYNDMGQMKAAEARWVDNGCSPYYDD